MSHRTSPTDSSGGGLRRRGLAGGDETDVADVWTEEAPALAALAAASRGGWRWRRVRAAARVGWASRMPRPWRGRQVDVMRKPTASVVALIEQTAVIGRILRHLRLPVEIPSRRPARAPPLDPDRPSHADWDGDPPVFTPSS